MNGTNQRTFPLLRLPLTAQKNVLRNMEILYLFGFSLCSRAIKSLVKSLNITANGIILTFRGLCNLTMVFKNRTIRLIIGTNEELQGVLLQIEHLRSRTGQSLGADVVQALQFGKERPIIDWYLEYWKKPIFTVKDWLEHFMSLCHCRSIDCLQFINPAYSIDSIEENTKGIRFNVVDSSDVESRQYSQEVVKRFYHANTVILDDNIFETATETHGFLVQNFMKILSELQLGLNDLLVTNFSVLDCYDPNLSEKKLNRFLKLWKKGSNPNLTRLLIETEWEPSAVNESLILSGLNSKIIPKSDVKIYEQRRALGRPYTLKIEEGFEIQRKDGTRATIVFHKLSNFRFEFFVWF
ncbi:hypothetical protein CAEBREN_23094 [Caenorhabditis brenneri]|uniref:F-box domain-containing protein n=1 Tax=Caenorhabditis brenneri TaxID=135651 RepID=G0MC03_CAEBE|nr:hypothetical protein CAEBREN_23094 [Caenorhabditis brenneri]